jgi:hypothetical protein
MNRTSANDYLFFPRSYRKGIIFRWIKAPSFFGALVHLQEISLDIK